MSNPKVSIILPTHNGSKYIRQSIDSCLNQTYRNIELIVVDDASKDATAQIIKSYADPRIQYFKNEKNLRLPSSLNVGFSHATGEYLTWTSDDNYYSPQAIECMLNYLVRTRGDFVYCDYYVVHEGRPAEPELIKLPVTPSFRDINPVRACFLYTRNVLERTGNYDPVMELVEDYDYWIRVSKNFAMAHLDTPLYFYRNHAQSLYSSRFDEVEVVKLLVRIKHGIANEKECAGRLNDMIARRKMRVSIPDKLYAKIILSKKIRLIFGQFKRGELDFNEAKRQLSSFVKGVDR